MKLKNYCRRVLYVTPAEKIEIPRVKSKDSLEDDNGLKSSDDEAPMVAEDVTFPSPQSKPPSFDPEDYALALVKHARTGDHYMVQEQQRDKKGRLITSNGNREPKGNQTMITREVTTTLEMTTKQFSSLPDLLKNLKDDLAVAYLSFVKELVREPHDGAWLLLDLLRTIQHGQTVLHNSVSSREQQTALKRALLDEHSCLSCLRYCLRSADTAVKLADYQQGLYALAVATMSNMSKSRTLALQLLTRVCETSSHGHRQVLDALSTLRLRFAESVRCKFLVSMLLSHPSPSFCVWCLRLLNGLVCSSATLRQRIHIQEELLEAGFDPANVKKTVERNGVEGAAFSSIELELERWNKSYVDVTQLGTQLDGLHSANSKLTHELSNLREANMKLLEENVLLKAVGGEVQEQYLALQRRLEHNGLPSAPSPVPSISDSDISSIDPVRRGTILRRPSRSSSGRSYIVDTNTFEKNFREGEHTRSTTPDVLPRRSAAAHVTSDTFTYASGQMVSNVVNSEKFIYDNATLIPDPLPRSTSMIPKVEHAITVQPLSTGVRNESPDSTTVIAPCYMNPMDLMPDDPDSTMNRYTPPINQQDTKHIASVHQKSTSVSKTSINGYSSQSSSSKSSLEKDKYLTQIKRKAPTAPSTKKNNKQRSSLSSSTSSLSSSASSDSSNNINYKGRETNNVDKKNKDEMDNKVYNQESNEVLYQNDLNQQYQNVPPCDPEYQNIPRTTRVLRGYDDIPASDEGDYEQDMVVYEAITLGNDMIELVRRDNISSDNSSNENSAKRTNRKYTISSSSSNGSSGSSKSNNSSIDSYVKNKNRLNSEISKMNDCDVSNVKNSVKHYENMVMIENKINKKDKPFNSNHDEDNDVNMKSAESSISLDSTDTVKENNIPNRSMEDRQSPDGRTSDELEIVPSRQRQVPRKQRSGSSHSITLFEFDSPTETSDTETLIRVEQCPSSPRTMETESTRSFGFIKPDRNLRRRDTMNENNADGVTKQEGMSKKKGLRRSGSFQAGDVSDISSSPKFPMKRRGSTDTLIDSGCYDPSELYINGRAFTRYSPTEGVTNEANELLTAALNRRQCRSVEDRLDQWLEEDLRRHSPPDVKNNNKKKECGRSASNHDDSRKVDKNSNKAKFLNNKKSTKTKNHHKRYSNGDLMAFNGFINPATGFIENDYGQNFMLNRPVAKRKTEFLGEKAEFGLHEFPAPQKLQDWNSNSKWQGVEIDPDIPTPDYVVTPAGTLTASIVPTHHGALHILDMPSGLY